MKHLAPTLSLCALLAFVNSASAKDLDPREIQARKECMAGRYQVGADLLAQLFAETGNPNFIFNQARCFEQNGKPDDALLRFQEYLRKAKDIPAEEKMDVEQHIAECKARMVEVTSGAAAVAPTNTAGPAGSPAVPVTEQVSAEPTSAQSPPAEAFVHAESQQVTAAQGSPALRTAGIVAASVGAAAVIAGLVFSLETKSIRDQVTSDNARRTYDRNKDDSGKLYGTLQWVGYGVGGAAIVGGAILYYLGAGETHASSSSVSLLPVLSTGRAGIAIQGSY